MLIAFNCIDMVSSVTAFFFACLLTMGQIPLLIFLSKRFQLIDQPNQRKVHIRNVSRLGGVAMFVSIAVTMALFYGVVEQFFSSAFWRIVMVGSLLAFATGFWDDLKNISAKTKLLFQLLIAVAACFLGFKIDEIQIGLTRTIDFGVFAPVVTVLWIVTVMNAFNMVDGLDGLAGGVAFIIFSTIALLGSINGNANVMFLSLACAGVCLGFLFFNFHPARIFMGDSGSMTLGFLLSILSIEVAKNGGPISMFTPVFLVAFPITDLITAVLRRLIHAKNTEKEVSPLGLLMRTFRADGNHIHHRLLKLGFSQRKIALIAYGFTVVNCFLGIISAYFSFGVVFFVFIFYVWFTVQCVQLLDYEEFVTKNFRDKVKNFEEKQKLSTAPSLIRKVN